jgi:hypothetical protein
LTTKTSSNSRPFASMGVMTRECCMASGRRFFASDVRTMTT